MHQPIIVHDEADVDPSATMIESPFWAWLTFNRYQMFHIAVLQYLGVYEMHPEMWFGVMHRSECECYRHIFHHFWSVHSSFTARTH